MDEPRAPMVTYAERDAAAGLLAELSAAGGDHVRLFAELLGPLDEVADTLNTPVERSFATAAAAVDTVYGTAAAQACWQLVVDSAHPVARGAAAWSTDTPAWVLVALAGDRHDYVRQGVAYNPATPPATLAALAGHVELVEMVLLNPSSGRDVLDAALDTLEGADPQAHTPWLALRLAREHSCGDADSVARAAQIEAVYRAARGTVMVGTGLVEGRIGAVVA